ncbi:MAG: hypothetical protein JAY84_03525 [Candidatus Thiodiazotropha taylori]|nr:hypothetical protein [Candidatus Thiodiazotropha taylori]
MAFVNDYATDEEIEKYDLYGIWDRFHPLRKGKYYIGQRPNFTIDREKNIFLLKVGSGGRENSSILKFLLWIDHKDVVIDLEKAKGSSENVQDNPYIIIWDIVKYYAQSDIQYSKDEILLLLKDALNVYGLLGVYRQVPNTSIAFNF